MIIVIGLLNQLTRPVLPLILKRTFLPVHLLVLMATGTSLEPQTHSALLSKIISLLAARTRTVSLCGAMVIPSISRIMFGKITADGQLTSTMFRVHSITISSLIQKTMVQTGRMSKRDSCLRPRIILRLLITSLMGYPIHIFAFTIPSLEH